MFTSRLHPATIIAAIITPLILWFRLLAISAGYVRNAPSAIVKPMSVSPKDEKRMKGNADAIVTLNALTKWVLSVNFRIWSIIPEELTQR